MIKTIIVVGLILFTGFVGKRVLKRPSQML